MRSNGRVDLILYFFVILCGRDNNVERAEAAAKNILHNISTVCVHELFLFIFHLITYNTMELSLEK